MGIVGLIIFVIIACVVVIVTPSEENGSSEYAKMERYCLRDERPKQSHNRRRSEEFEFEPSDSYYDEDGNEHEVDDDGFCEECDDYHE